MTANDVLNTTLTLMFADLSEADDYKSPFISVLNLLLAETFELNNSIRLADGLDVLTDIPEVSELTDVMTYEEGLCRAVLPFGAAGMLMTEDNAAAAAQYKNKYEYEKANAYKAEYSVICDANLEDE